MYYTILRNLDFKTDCFRCHVPLSVGVQFIHNGKLILVGRECAKHFGIVWTPKVGPCANDPEMFNKAVEIINTMRYNTDHNIHPRWPGGWEVCLSVKEALGYLAWQRAIIAGI